MNEKTIITGNYPALNQKSFSKTGFSLPTPTKDEILICTLGGTGQIGMNWTLYGYDGHWILVDAGIAFAPRDIEGVEGVVPDISVLRSIKLSGLVVTHAHEDHIGAIHRLWPQMSCPIYATPFAAAVIRHRFFEAATIDGVAIKTFAPGESIKFPSFIVDTIPLTHSAPECVGLVINTPIGKVLHTGDWKFDPEPIIGHKTDMNALQALGDDGVLAMVCDSTNADRSGPTTSERDVAEGIEAVFRDAQGMVVVSCFASNVARLASVAHAANRTGRLVGVAGRSLIRMEEAARDAGLLDGVPQFLADARHLRGLDRNEMVLLCTGVQGEERAALAKYARNQPSYLPNVEESDTLIHSGRVIPGHEDDLSKIFNRLREQHVTIHEREFKGKRLHVTGHAVSNEIAEMYGLVRPRFAIPVHGEAHHMEAHADIARSSGVEDVRIPSEGDVFGVSVRGIRRIGSVEVKLVIALSGDNKGVFLPWERENPYAIHDRMELLYA